MRNIKRELCICLLLVSLIFLVGCGASAPQSGANGAAGDYYYGSMGGNSYLELKEKGFSNTADNNKVNLSLDTSTASYSNIRKLINANIPISKDAVNIEQMLNYFSYSYVNETEEQLTSFLEISKCPWNEENHLLSVAIKAKEYELSPNVQNNFVFLLDVSGSMYSYDKLPLMIEAFNILVNNLGDNDRISIVTYAGSNQVLLDGGFGYEKIKISAIISDLEAGGSTAGAQGIQTAYQLASKYFIEGGNNRVFLATDGDFNVGISSTSALKNFISEKRELGIYLSIFGFGDGNLRSDIMDTLSQAGNGNYYYIDTVLEAQKVFVSELGGTLQTVAKDAKVQIEFNQEIVEKYRVIGYENKYLTDEEFNDSETDAGEIGAGHTTVCLIEIKLYEEYDTAVLPIVKSTIRYKDVLDNEMNKEVINECSSVTIDASIDFIFQSCVAEFGLLLRTSEYANPNLNNILIRLNNDQFKEDVYKAEFISLVNKYGQKNSGQ